MLYTTNPLVLAAVALVAPLIGGTLTGIDRKLTARLQGRVGPPLLQPFYDAIKLWGKTPEFTNHLQLFFVYGYLASAVTSLLLIVAGQDLLMTSFVLAFASVCLILGGMSVRSPYVQIGGQREIFQVLSYEPLLVLAVIGIYLKTGTFMLRSTAALREPLLFSLPVLFLGILAVGGIKLRKSPFDTAASAHAHQELVRGLLTEYSGPYLAIIEVTHWVELVMLLALFASFWSTSLIGGLLLAAAGFLFEIIVDNITARLTWHWLLRTTWTWGLGLAALNLLFIYLKP